MSACASLTGLSDFPWAPVWLFPPPHVGCPIPSSQTWHHQAWPSHSWAHGCHEDVVRLPQAHWSSNPFASLLSHPVMAGHFPVLQVGSRTQVSPPLRSPNLLCMGGFLSIAPLHTMGQDQVQGPDQCLTPGPSSQLSHQFWAWRIYFFFFFWLRWVFIAAHGLSLVVESQGYSLLQCTGFSLRWLLLLRSTGSRRAGFSSCSTRAQ